MDIGSQKLAPTETFLQPLGADQGAQGATPPHLSTHHLGAFCSGLETEMGFGEVKIFQ